MEKLETTPKLTPSPRLNVVMAGKPAAMDAPGGGEVQMLATARALASVGVHSRLVLRRTQSVGWLAAERSEAPDRAHWGTATLCPSHPSAHLRCDGVLGRPPEDGFDGVDCLHLFGSVPEHLPLLEAARAKGVPVVLSTIAWFELINCLREPRPWPSRLAACGRFLARAACPQLPSWRRRLYHAVDLLLPNSSAEAEQLIRYFGVPAEKIHVVPNGADERFADAPPEPFARLAGTRDFVLCAGRIEPRKNQLQLLRAMRGTGAAVVILGDVVPGCRWYLDRCRRAADRHVRFVGRLGHDDPRLASAYAACRCLVLPSWFETPGLAALEAATSGTPLVLPEGGSAREYFGEFARYVRPGDRAGIRRAVTEATSQGRSRRLAEHVRGNFTWNAAALATREAYEKIG